MTALRISLDEKYSAEQGCCLLTGLQALVRLPLDQIRADRRAGLNTGGFISGYRGSPLGGYDQQLARAKRFLDEHNIHFQPGVNEDLAATAVWGSQQVHLRHGAKAEGVFGLWYGKTPGLDRSGDAFKHANMAGTAPFGGVVAVAGDDSQAKSSTLACQSEFAFMNVEIPVLAPSGVQDLLDLGLHAIAMSRFSGLWIGMAATSDILDGSATVNVDPARMMVTVPPDDGTQRHISMSNLSLSGRLETERQLRNIRHPLARLYARHNRLNRIIQDSHNPRIGIAVSGKNWQAFQDVLRLLGIGQSEIERFGLRIMKVSMPWPLDESDMRVFASGLETVLVVEAKRSLIETQLRDLLYDLPQVSRPAIIGKSNLSGAPLLPGTGDLLAENIAPAVLGILPEEAQTDAMKSAVDLLKSSTVAANALATPSPRTPYFCSGCPHNRSTIVPDGSIALAGIGCHIMAQAMPGHSAEATTHMGAEGTTWIGQAPFSDDSHIFVNLGDGTYHHSGSLAIRAAVAAKVNVTYKILYNDAVAMTGGQHVDGPQSVSMIARQVAAEGVARICIVAADPERHDSRELPHGASIYGRDDLDYVQRDLREIEGVTVLIYDQTCAAEKRRRRKRGEYPVPGKRLFINERVCEDCGDCSVQSNCISVEPVETAFGTKRRINQSSCNMDFSCAKGLCPSFMEIEGVQLKGPEIPPNSLIEAATDLPLPDHSRLQLEYKILLSGIGGMGVTTVSAILAMAAHIDGKQAATLDVTGLAQKGGAVLSHVAIAPAGAAEPVARIAPGRADTLIAGDIIVSAGAESLAMCDPARTRAVTDSDFAPTAEFVMHGTQNYRTSRPELRVRKAVRDLTGCPTTSMAERLIGDQLYSNMMLTGAAFQQGLIPISLDAIEQAIGLNDVAVEKNLAAFHAGRLAVAKPEALPDAARSKPRTPETLNALIARLSSELIAYADDAYAEHFSHLVERVRKAEAALIKNRHMESFPLTRAVAENFYKLMAYKDEYEIARLYTDPEFKNRLEDAFGGYSKLSVLLAPPLLSRTDPVTGRPKKISFGPWIFKLFSLLSKLKSLRGTCFDPFGWTAERRKERELIVGYERTVELLIQSLTLERMNTVLAIARLPEDISGYGLVKMARIKEAQIKQLKLLAELNEAFPETDASQTMIAAE